MKPTLFFLFLLFSANVYSQPSIQWQKCYGGTDDEAAEDIAKTADGGYIMVGSTLSNNGDVTGNHGGRDVWVAKISSTGSLSWQKSYGGGWYDRGTTIRQTSDGGYIVGGFTSSLNGDVTGYHPSANTSDAWIIKLDAAGTIQWAKCYGGTGNEGDSYVTIKETAGGGYIFVTTTTSTNGDVTGIHPNSIYGDIWVVKLDNSGTINWQKCYGGSLGETGLDIEQTTDGGYVVCGISTSSDGDLTGNHGMGDCWVLKITGNGTITWQKNYGGSDKDWGYSVHQCKDGGYIISGITRSNDGDVSGLHAQNPPNDDIWVVKTDVLGSIIWTKTIGGTEDESGWKAIESDDGSYVIAGMTNSNDGDIVGYHNSASVINGDALLFSLYQDGSLKWLNCYGGSAPDASAAILQTADTGFILMGNTMSIDGDATNSGFHITSSPVYDFWAVKFSSVLGIEDLNSSKLKVYPTISTGNVNIELPQGYENTTVHLFNLLGQEIKINTTTGLNRTIHIDNAPARMYTLQLRNNGEVKNYKIVYQP